MKAITRLPRTVITFLSNLFHTPCWREIYIQTTAFGLFYQNPVTPIWRAHFIIFSRYVSGWYSKNPVTWLIPRAHSVRYPVLCVLSPRTSFASLQILKKYTTCFAGWAEWTDKDFVHYLKPIDKLLILSSPYLKSLCFFRKWLKFETSVWNKEVMKLKPSIRRSLFLT